IAVPLAGLTVLAVDLRDPLDRGEDHQVGKTTLRRPLHRLTAALRRAPHGWVRRLDRTRPGVDVVVAIVLAVEREGPGLRPGAQDQLSRLVKALARMSRIHAGREILRADAAYKARDHAPAGGDVEHRDLLRDAKRVLAERQAIAEDRDLRAGRAAHEHRRHDVRARHRAVAVLMVLVHADAVPAERLRVLELIEILVVECVSLRGIVKPI